jgi:predicted RNA-binding Zn ribbon-like protein
MSKQRRAPGELERVRRFVNTRQIGQATDLLTEPAGLAAWLEEESLAPAGLSVTRADLARAIELRGALRAMLAAHDGETVAPAEACRTLDDAARRARLRLRFDVEDSASLVPEAAGVAGALGRLVAIVHDSIARDTWSRLKVCRDDTCGWAFYDHTKNHSGAWCSMEKCGNRAKARAYRERHTARGPGRTRSDTPRRRQARAPLELP